MPLTAYHAVVSYRREDLDLVEPIVNGIRQMGLSLWFDQDCVFHVAGDGELQDQRRGRTAPGYLMFKRLRKSGT